MMIAGGIIVSQWLEGEEEEDAAAQTLLDGWEGCHQAMHIHSFSQLGMVEEWFF